MQNIAKNHIIEVKIFDDDYSCTDGIKEDVEEKNKEILDLLIAESYSYTMAITHMH